MKNILILILLFSIKAYTCKAMAYIPQETGWIQYTDSVYTVGSPFTITSGNTDTLENNANGVIDNQKPYDVPNWYNAATKKLTPTENGDAYIVRLRFKAKTTANNDYMTVMCDIGAPLGVIYEETKVFPKGANTEHSFIVTMDIFTAATFVANGGIIYVTAATGDLSIYEISYLITRIHRANI